MLRSLWLCCGFVVLAAGSVASQTSSPEKPDPAKEAFVFERIVNRIRYENDGTGTRDTVAVIRVQSQAGVREFGQLIFGYSSATESLEVSYVRVRKPDGRTLETPPASAQDFAPEILKQAPMYSDYRQRHISVAGLQAGDVLEYHTLVRVNTPLIPGQFWYEYSFPKGVFVNEDRLEIDVPKTRELKLKSPEHKRETQETGDRRVYTWVDENIVPDRKKDRSEEQADSEEIHPDVQLSTFTDWQQLGKWYGKMAANQATPNDELRKKAVELTQGARSTSEKVQRLYNFVALNIRYVSLSFGLGRYEPHAASEVLRNGYGDCKDKHTLLEALLQAENIPSYPVLIDSSRKLDEDVPSPAQFDHVITALPSGQETLWLDTTAEVAPFGMILYPLRNKMAVYSSPDSSAGLRRTSAVASVKNLVSIITEGKFTPYGALDAQVEITAQGDSDLPLRMAFRQVPQARWEDLLNGFAAYDGEVTDLQISSLEDTSQPLHIRYHVHRDDYFRVPSTDTQFYVLPPVILPRTSERHPPSKPIDIGPAIEQLYRAHIQLPENYSVHTPPSVRMSRDYGDFSADYNVVKSVLQAERHMVLRVNELPGSRRSDYESFRNLATEPLGQLLSAAITTPQGSSAATVAKTSGTPRELHEAAASALRHKDFAGAVDLLKMVVEKDPNQQGAWYDLGRAYAGLNDHDEAIGAFRKQIALDGFHPRASYDLGTELQQQGKLDEAVAAYRKQLEIVPNDKLAHKNLGLILTQLRRDPEARSELETAAAFSPDDPDIKMALAEVYARSGDAEKAKALTQGLTGSAPLASGSDFYAPVLRDDINVSQSLRDARRALDDVGEQFESGDYDRLGPSAFSAMNLVALSWARIGWANFQQGEILEAMKYLTASWALSQSGTVANRLARALQKEGQADKARHMFALAVAAGGDDVEASRQQLLKLEPSPEAAQQEVNQSRAELIQMRTVKLPSASAPDASAQFNLVFDSSTKAERAEYFGGDQSLRGADQQLRQVDCPVKFPDVSSVKIIRRGTVSCTHAGCSLLLLLPASIQPPAPVRATATPGSNQ